MKHTAFCVLALIVSTAMAVADTEPLWEVQRGPYGTPVANTRSGVFMVSGRYYVMALDALTGEPSWVDLSIGPVGGPSNIGGTFALEVVGDSIFSSGGIFANDLDDGEFAVDYSDRIDAVVILPLVGSPVTFEWVLAWFCLLHLLKRIGIGRALTDPLLPQHPAYGSRTRAFPLHVHMEQG